MGENGPKNKKNTCVSISNPTAKPDRMRPGVRAPFHEHTGGRSHALRLPCPPRPTPARLFPASVCVRDTHPEPRASCLRNTTASQNGCRWPSIHFPRARSPLTHPPHTPRTHTSHAGTHPRTKPCPPRGGCKALLTSAPPAPTG